MTGVVKKLLELDYEIESNIDEFYVISAKKNIELLHKDDDGFICIAEKNKNKMWLQYHYKYEELVNNIEKAISEETNIYVTPNSFYKPFRKIENIRHLNSLYIDVDFYKVNNLKDKNVSEVMKIIDDKFFKTNVLPKPSFALFTGKGLAYYWRIKPCPISVLALWNVCQRYFVEQLAPVGGDNNSIDSARVMKLAGSFHTKSSMRARLYIFDEDKVYDLGDIQRNYLPELNPDTESLGDRVHKKKHVTKEEYFEKISKNAIKHSRSKKASKVLKLYNQLNLHYTRLMDLVKLQELRHGMCRNSKGELVPDGQRELMCFLYRYWYCLYSNDKEQALECTLDFNNNFKDPLPRKDVERITVSAVKAYEEWKSDEEIKNNPLLSESEKSELMGKVVGNTKYYHKGYNYNNSTLIRKLHISEEEQGQLKTIISKTERKKRQSIREKRERRNENGLTPKQAEKVERLKKIEKLYRQGLKQTEIAKQLNLSKYIVSRDIKKIKEDDNNIQQVL